MYKDLSRLLFVIAIGWSFSLSVNASDAIDFNRDIRPILAENCYFCHGNDAQHRMADLRLDVREDAIAGGAIVPGEADASLLIERILSDDPDLQMPPSETQKQVTPQQRELLVRWINEDAPYAAHWAFVPPSRSAVPAASDSEVIDELIAAKLDKFDLELSPPASLETLIRRVSLDLIGLPPTPAEIDTFLAAAAVNEPLAYAQLVDRLLASPHYGERWGRWWLDQARYADSNGYSIDAPRQIWKYRDWVIQAFNEDLPFDQFTIQQLAGDLLPESTIHQQIATGFHRNTQLNQEGGIDREQFRIDSVFDRVATTGTVWLGLSIGCAQCHDHKFDPIEQREFYRFFAFLNNQDEPTIKVYPDDLDVPQLRAEAKELQAKLDAHVSEQAAALANWEQQLTDEKIEQLPKSAKQTLKVPADKRNAAQRQILYACELGVSGPFQAWTARVAAIDKVLNNVPTTLVLKERSQARKTTVFINGDFTRPAEEVTPGTLAVLHPLESGVEHESGAEHESGEARPNRLNLARWIMDRRNPLTSRVIINRVWQQYFGRGIVETENDFGLQGAAPSHPELLDWLALEFMDRGWSLKEMHRLIVGSKTYRQSSIYRPELQAADPNNYLLARQSRLRLDAEIIRDVALVASGLLTPKLGGPSVFPPLPEGVMGQGQVKRAWQESPGEDKFRRGLYTFVYRGSPHPTLSVFDASEGLSTCTRRLRSNTPLQSLTLLNDRGFFEFAQALAAVIEDSGLPHAFRRCTSRDPEPAELEILSRLDTLNAARLLLNLDETITRE
ncbi:PSD1 and planctomycete cytochrome C domain-containing protein [Planctomycetaceae bacterium SH139]